MKDMPPRPSCPICQASAVSPLFPLSPAYSIYRCRGCTGEFLWPPQSAAELTALYAKEYFQAWGLEEGEKPSIRQMKIATFRHHLQLITAYTTAGNLLDVGCAFGYLLEGAQEFGFTPYGLEISEYAAAAAQKKFGSDHIVHGTIEDTPFPPKFFDVITMFDLLEHIPHPIPFLRHVRALLKDDGLVALGTPNPHSFSRLFLGKRWTHYKLEHLTYFTPRSLRALAKATGFEVTALMPLKKALSPEYLYSQFTVYPHPLFTPLARAIFPLLPPSWRVYPLTVTIGEMFAILHKTSDA